MESDDDIDQRAFRLGEIQVEPTRNILKKDGEIYSLEPLIMDVLCLMATHNREVVTRDSLISQIWGVEYGADESLTRAISLLRKTFRTAGEPDGYIETIPKRGYRLREPVCRLQIEDVPLARPVQAKAAAGNVPIDKAAAPIKDGLENTAKTGEAMPLLKWPLGKAFGYSMAVMVFLLIGLGAASHFMPGQKPGVGGTAPIGKGRSVAVLSFADLTAQKDQGYFSDGMAEEILSELSKIPDLRVAPRASAFALKGQNIDMREAGQKLNVSHIVDGSVRKQGNQVRITAQLINTSTGQSMWTHAYDGNMDDILKLQKDISAEIADELKLMLSIGVEEVIVLEPGGAPVSDSSHISAPEETSFPEAATVIKARPDSMVQHLWAGTLGAQHVKDPEAALQLIDIKTEGQPYNMALQLEKGRLLTDMGQYQDAFIVYESVRQHDPISALTLTYLSAYYRQVADYAEAMRTARRNIRWNPDSSSGRLDLAVLLSADGDISGAHMILLDAAKAHPKDHDVTTALFKLYTALDLPEAAESRAQSEAQKIISQVTSGNVKGAQKRQRKSKSLKKIGLAAYALGDMDGAYPGFKQLIDDFHLTAYPATPDNIEGLAMAVHVASAKKDPDAGALAVQLESYFDARPPLTLALAPDLKASIMLAALNRDGPAVIKRLEYAASQGLADTAFLSLSLFVDYKSDPQWLTAAQNIEANAARHRQIVKSQIASHIDD